VPDKTFTRQRVAIFEPFLLYTSSVPAPILATKLFIPPPRPNAVARPRLLARLNDAFQRKLTLLSAPAGFGKTTLLSEWIAECGLLNADGKPAANPPPISQPQASSRHSEFAWLSLDEGDADPARFLAYLVAALQTVAPEPGAGVLAALQAPQASLPEALLTMLLNDLAARPAPLVLILDDYHTVDGPAIDQALTFLVEHLPPQLHLVLATREDPQLPLPRLRARGQLVELRATDLRFTPAEAADFLNQGMGLALSEADAAALEARTEGWIAGLQLAALALQGAPSRPGQADTARFIQAFTGSHHFVLDYLLQEVLHQQSEPIQTFLLGTALLDRLCGPLCDAVLGGETGQATLEYLERANLFIVPLDNERRWYRYHHLFADLLRQRLGQSLKAEAIAAYHLRASVWHAQNGQPAEAFHHALAAGDLARAAGLAEGAWQAMDDSFQSGAWLAWVKKLPGDVFRTRPVLSTQTAMAFMDAGEPENSEAYLREAERGLAAAAGELSAAEAASLKPLPAMIAMTRAYNAQVQGNLPATARYAEQALQLIPAEDVFRRAQATVMLEFVHWASGDLAAAQRAMSDWMQTMEQLGHLTFVVASAFALADLLTAQGKLHEAANTYQQALQLATAQGPEAERITAHHHLGLAMLWREMGQSETAAPHLQKARELGEQTTLVDWPYRWHLAQARLAEAEGNLEGALAELDAAQRLYVKNPVPDLRPVAALKAQLYLKQGRLSQAQAWARDRGLAATDALSYLREFEHLTLARVLIAAYQAGQGDQPLLEALDLLARLLAAAEAQGRLGNALEILVVQALAYQAQGRLPLAFAALQQTLALAQPEGYVRTFVDEGNPMRLLMVDFREWIEKQAQGQGQALTGYVDRLLAAFAPPAASPSSVARHPQSAIVEPLSDRELEILRLIAQGLSNREIAQRLFLAISTVKGHNLKIFGKLQVQSRTEAIALARELGWL